MAEAGMKTTSRTTIPTIGVCPPVLLAGRSKSLPYHILPYPTPPYPTALPTFSYPPGHQDLPILSIQLAQPKTVWSAHWRAASFPCRQSAQTVEPGGATPYRRGTSHPARAKQSCSAGAAGKAGCSGGGSDSDTGIIRGEVDVSFVYSARVCFVHLRQQMRFPSADGPVYPSRTGKKSKRPHRSKRRPNWRLFGQTLKRRCRLKPRRCGLA